MRAAGESEAEQAEAEKMFKDVGEAYAALSDPEKKERYDAGVDIEDLEGGGGMPGGMDPSEIFRMFQGQGGMGGGFGGMGGGGGGFSFG